MPRLLIICSYFPPIGGAGAQRPAKFAKYLAALGWDLCVLAPAPGCVQSRWAPRDESLELDLREVRVCRVAAAVPASTWRPRIDAQQDWAHAAWQEARRLLRAEPFDAVLITLSPFSLAHAALSLKQEFATPAVLDLRDPWALDGWPSYRTYLQWRQHYRFMRRSLEGVDGVIANTPAALEALKAAAPGLPQRRWTVIPNGYDAEDFESCEAASPDREWLTIVHTGSLHSAELYPPRGLAAQSKRLLRYRPEPLQPAGRTLKFLLAALRQLRDCRHPGAERVRIRCVGAADPATQRCVAESEVADAVELKGYLPHRESVQTITQADALFLPLHGYADRKRRSLIVPGKTYEYLASGRPILACLPASDAREMVERSGRGYLAYPTDQTEVTEALARLIDDWRSGSLPGGPPEAWVRQYERAELTSKLAEFITGFSGGAKSDASPALAEPPEQATPVAAGHIP